MKRKTKMQRECVHDVAHTVWVLIRIEYSIKYL